MSVITSATGAEKGSVLRKSCCQDNRKCSWEVSLSPESPAPSVARILSSRIALDPPDPPSPMLLLSLRMRRVSVVELLSRPGVLMMGGGRT